MKALVALVLAVQGYALVEAWRNQQEPGVTFTLTSRDFYFQRPTRDRSGVQLVLNVQRCFDAQAELIAGDDALNALGLSEESPAGQGRLGYAAIEWNGPRRAECIAAAATPDRDEVERRRGVLFVAGFARDAESLRRRFPGDRYWVVPGYVNYVDGKHSSPPREPWGQINASIPAVNVPASLLPVFEAATSRESGEPPIEVQIRMGARQSPQLIGARLLDSPLADRIAP